MTEYIIRIILVVAAILIIIALFNSFGVFQQITLAIGYVNLYLPPLVATLVPYLAAGRSLANMIVGIPLLVDIALWFVLSSPLILAIVKLTSKLLAKLVG